MGWRTGWGYRKLIPITGQSGAGEDFQVAFSIASVAGGNVYLEGHCEDFPEDVIFTAADGVTKLPFWIKDKTADPITGFVKVAADLDTDKNIYVYYGKSGETSESDFDNTFTKDYGESGLVGLWHCDEGSGETLTDSSGEGHTGTFKGVGEPGWVGADGGHWDGETTVTFSTGDSLAFAGDDDFVGFGNVLNLGTGDFTIIAWVKFNGLGVADNRNIVTKYQDSSNLWFFGINLANKLYFYGKQGGTIRVYFRHDVATISDNNYHLIAFSADRDGAGILCIDGVEVSGYEASTMTANDLDNTGDFNIGKYINEYLDGNVDEIRRYNRALPVAEMNAYCERRKYAATEPAIGAAGDEEEFVCTEEDTKCVGYDLYTCTDNAWLLTEENNVDICGYEAPAEGLGICIITVVDIIVMRELRELIKLILRKEKGG